MVVDTTYYDALGVGPEASELEIKKAYRKLAITTHPDKNPGDETAHARFQAVGEAYQILSNKDLRAQYDKYGKEKAIPHAGFEDPSEFFSMIFGGDAFVDIIGELTLMKDLTHTLDITMENMQEDELAKSADEKLHVHDEGGKSTAETSAKAKEDTPFPAENFEMPPPSYPSAQHGSDPALNSSQPSEPGSGANTPRRYLGQQAIMDRSEEDVRMDAAGLTPEEKDLQKKKKKGILTKEQRERLAAYEEERRVKREERVTTLSKKLVDRLSVWTETDKDPAVTHAFQEKTKLEAENLKMESFGVEILHAVGTTYLQKGTAFLKSQKFLGISGFWARLKDKGTLAKDTWNTISTAIDAQLTMEEMAKLEEKGGADWTDEKKAEYERKVMGKILAAAWRGNKFEIQGILREVCERVLNDKSVRLEKRIERAHALVLVGSVFQRAERDPDEEGDYMAFEQLMAESMKKQEKKKDKDKDKQYHSHRHQTHADPSGSGRGSGKTSTWYDPLRSPQTPNYMKSTRASRARSSREPEKDSVAPLPGPKRRPTIVQPMSSTSCRKEQCNASNQASKGPQCFLTLRELAEIGTETRARWGYS